MVEFYKGTVRREGKYCSVCKARIPRENSRRYREKHYISKERKVMSEEERRSKAKEHYRKSRELMTEEEKKLFQAQRREYYKQNIEKERQRHREQYQRHRAKKLVENKIYRSAHKDKRKEIARRRKLRLNGVSPGHTNKEFEELKRLYNNCCAYCGKHESILPYYNGVSLTRDHIIPIAKNGSDRIDNIIPACFSCNSKKGIS